MWVAFALQSFSHFCSKNITIFENTFATTIKEFVINELVKLTNLWTTGPWYVTKELPKYSDHEYKECKEWTNQQFLWKFYNQTEYWIHPKLSVTILGLEFDQVHFAIY